MAFYEKATVVKVLTVQCPLGVLVMVMQSQLSVNFAVIMSNMHGHVHL